jgi:hypothetical protein
LPRLDLITAGGLVLGDPSPPRRVAHRALVAGSAMRWLVPDLALAVAIFTTIYLLTIFGGPSALFRDADAGWHIRAGERILATGSLPGVDFFSFSKPGETWVAWEWGADVLVGGIHRVAGLSGVAFIYALAIGASVWMWVRLNWAAGGNFLLTCLFAAPMLSTVNLHWLARPHVFGWLFFIGTVWFCERIPQRISLQTLSVVAAFGAVWANVHASFFMGPAIAAIYAFGIWTGSAIWERRSIGPRNYLLVAFAAATGSLINPHGWYLHQHVLAYLSNSELLDRIGEFQSFNFHAAGSAQIIAALLIGLGGGFAALSARRLERFVLAMVLTAAALRSARMLPVAALALLPLANGSLTFVLANAALKARLRKALDAVLDYGLRLRAIDRTVSGIAFIPVAALVLFGVLRAAHPAFPADQFPVTAASSVAALPAGARVFAPDKFGGYLIYRFAGERKVFFDGRSDFYGASFLTRYSRMVQVRPGWREEFARWHFTHALLPADYSLIPALEADGWRELHRDPTAVLLEGPGV